MLASAKPACTGILFLGNRLNHHKGEGSTDQDQVMNGEMSIKVPYILAPIDCSL